MSSVLPRHFVTRTAFFEERFPDIERNFYRRPAETTKRRVREGMATNFDYLLKIVIIGDQNVGKSSILLRYADNSFMQQSMPTIGVDFKIKTLTIFGKTVKLQIWDTAGQEKFRNITTSYYRGAHGIVIVFDTTNEQSFLNVPSWLMEVSRYVGNGNDVKKLLIGNKVDDTENRKVSTEAIAKFAEQHSLPFIETSAKDATNITSVFTTMAENIISTLQGGTASPKPKDGRFQLDGRAVESNEPGWCC